MDEKFNKNAKVEQLTKMILRIEEEKPLSLKILNVLQYTLRNIARKFSFPIFNLKCYTIPLTNIVVKAVTSELKHPLLYSSVVRLSCSHKHGMMTYGH